MVNSPLMISVSGVRGIVGQSLTPEVALRWAGAFGSRCRPGPVVVGGDSRPSRVMMREAAFSGLTSAGSRVIDLGIVPTPTVALALRHHRARGGIAITASHNPVEWNAFKFYGGDGLFLSAEEGDALRRHVESSDSFSVKAADIGSPVCDDGAVRRHLNAVLAIPFLNATALREREFRVGLDTVCGAGGELLNSLLGTLGCEVVGFHLEPTGRFPRNPEPVPEHLREVGMAMRESHVDIGFVADPDADRLAVILETGEPASEELTLVAAADVALRYLKGPVVANCSTTRALDDVAARRGSAVTRTKVGEAHVARKMIEIGAVVGGEGNGGVMLPVVHPARDAAVGITLILQGLLESGGAASSLAESLPRYSMIKRRVTFSDLARLRLAMETVEKRAQLGNPDRLDGLKWTVGEAWVQVRASNTEPIVRVIAEARDAREAEELAGALVRALG